MRIAFVLATYPASSETFARREIAELRGAGTSVLVWALRAGPIDPGAADPSAAPAIYRPARLSRDAIISLVWLIARRPMGLFRLVACILHLGVYSPRWALRLLVNVHTVAHFARCAVRDDVEQVHGYFLNLPGVLAMAVSQVCGLPLTLAGHARDVFVEAGPLTLLLARARRVRVCNADAARHLRRAALQPARGRIHLIHHGIDVEHWDAHSSLREHAEPLVLAIGRFVHKKGFDVLVRSAAVLRLRNVPLHLAIVGDGPVGPLLRQLAADAKLNGCVTFPGWLSQDQVRALLQQASVLVVPSRASGDGDRDGLPNVVLEAAACGLPIVASRLPGLCDFLDDGCNGLLCPPDDPACLADCLQRLLADAQLRRQLGLQARKTVVERFGLQRCREQLEAFFVVE